LRSTSHWLHVVNDAYRCNVRTGIDKPGESGCSGKSFAQVYDINWVNALIGNKLRIRFKDIKKTLLRSYRIIEQQIGLGEQKKSALALIARKILHAWFEDRRYGIEMPGVEFLGRIRNGLLAIHHLGKAPRRHANNPQENQCVASSHIRNR